MSLPNTLETAQPALQALTDKAQITAADVAALRAALAERPLTRADACALFAIEAGAETPAEWTPFFVSALTDLVVWKGSSRLKPSSDETTKFSEVSSSLDKSLVTTLVPSEEHPRAES